MFTDNLGELYEQCVVTVPNVDQLQFVQARPMSLGHVECTATPIFFRHRKCVESHKTDFIPKFSKADSCRSSVVMHPP